MRHPNHQTKMTSPGAHPLGWRNAPGRGLFYGGTMPKIKMRVSAQDRDLLRMNWTTHTGYARRNVYVGTTKGRHKYKTQWAHRVVLERVVGRTLGRWELCDHINGDKLDNRRSNLRLTDAFGNNQHKPLRAPSGYRGANWHKRTSAWVGRVRTRGNVYDLGYFDTSEDAGLACWKKRRELGFLGEPHKFKVNPNADKRRRKRVLRPRAPAAIAAMETTP